ncbi:MAG TPA: regulatory protein RecX [Thermoleophilaceae bacterium]|nr:regulatory protein RecX [Thermoleophilaceae bacterium]
MRDRSVAELRVFLEGKRVEPDAIDEVVAELERTHVLDDARFAERFTEDRRALSGWGPERIEKELVRRGIPPELIEPALGRRTRTDELEAARGLLAERFANLDDDRARNRAWQLLVRRGYDAELAYDAVRAQEHAA